MLSMEVLFKFFTQYNLGIWPMPIVAYALCIIALFAAFKKFKNSDRTIAAIFAFFWLWLGIMFWLPGSAIFLPAYAFAAFCVIQGVLFLIGVVRSVVSYRIGTDIYSITGIVLILYALIGYPLVGYAIGHTWPITMLVGAFPCPTTVFTFGLFLCTESKVPKYLLVVPLLFAVYGILAGSRGIVEDIGLVVAGTLAIAMIVYRDRKVMIGHAPRPA